MNWVDFAIIAVIAWFTFASLRAGFIREACALAGAVIGVILAGQFYHRFATDIEVFIDDARAAEVSAFIVIFGATVLGAQMIALFLKRAASLLMLGPLDAMGGGVLGFIKGFVIVEALLIAAVTFPDAAHAGRRSELVASPASSWTCCRSSSSLLPQEFKDAIDALRGHRSPAKLTTPIALGQASPLVR